MNPPNKLSDDTVLNAMRTALGSCRAAGVYPSNANLRRHGYRGSHERFDWALEQLVASGEIPVSEAPRRPIGHLPVCERPPVPPGLTKMQRRRLGKCKPKVDAVRAVRLPRYDSPVWDEIVAGEKAWKRLLDWKRLWGRAKGASAT